MYHPVRLAFFPHMYTSTDEQIADRIRELQSLGFFFSSLFSSVPTGWQARESDGVQHFFFSWSSWKVKLFQLGCWFLLNLFYTACRHNNDTPRAGIDHRVFVAHEQINGNDGGSIAGPVACFVAYLAPHLRLLSPLTHIPLMHWTGHWSYLYLLIKTP